MSFRFACLATALVALAGGARAQQVIVSDDGSEMVVVDGPQMMQLAAHAEPAKDDAPSGPPTARLEKLKKLDFDRRPSAILAAWANPPKPEPEEKPAEAKAPDAKPAEPPPAEAKTDAAASDDANKKPDDPEAAKKAAEAEAKKKKAEEEAKRKAEEAKALEKELAQFRRDVTLGDWTAVKTYLAGLTKDEKKTGYERMLQSLVQGPPQRPDVPQQGRAYVEKNRFSPDDVLGLAAAAPQELTKDNMTALGALLRQALDAGHQLPPFLRSVSPHLTEPGFGLTQRQLALVLVNANEPISTESVLPSLDVAVQTNDREGLNLISRYCLARWTKENKVTWLEQAWTATQAVLAVGEVDEQAKSEALKRAVDIAPKIQKELGQAWLDESFTQRPERGMEILAAIGTASASALPMQPLDADARFKLLELETTAAKALLAAAPERAGEWSRELALLADNWLHEAQVAYQLDESQGLGPRMQRDPYGNFFYWDAQQQFRGNLPKPISTAQILEIRPSDEWLAHLDPTLQPRFDILFAQLLLKVGEEGKAFPYIEHVAATLPVAAKDLVAEFLRVWAKNHNPNNERQRSNPYIYFYGFEERANGIPLTRSKQERNLKELGEWIARLRKLPVEIDDAQIAMAFTSAHSAAEVFRLELIEQIFGPIKELKPATLAELLQTMRANLVTVWRDPALQEKSKTNRHQQDMQAEVMRGYELARSTVDGALADHPESWELWLVKAAVQHDENNFKNELKKDPEFSTRREACFETFHKAASLYAAQVESLEREKETTKVYETWFYAALGACDLKAIDHEQTLASSEIPLIRDAIAALPGERAERHTAMFASALFSRMSSAAPAVKFRYVREGLTIAGDHKLAREAREVYDYYKDLVTEIQLRTTVDGSDRVGHGEPFGLRVDIRHTREIERESGGFSKYLQNQNAMQFSFNYGRPTEDYRDKFEEAARETLKEHFDVKSITFNDPKTQSRADAEYGWRVTPYAYILLAPRGPQIDRVPPLRLDLDFLDTTGYAILPVESAVLPIDASGEKPEERPYSKLALTQTLDERQAKDGKLLLEVKASAIGLVPDLDALFDFAPEGFDVVKRDDHGLSIVKFDEAQDAIDSERTWTLTMRAKEGLAKLPDSFTFGKTKVETASSDRFRYVDADLASVEPTISLERSYGKPSRAWMWWTAAAVALCGAVLFVARKTRRPQAVAQGRFHLPEQVTPFTVLGLLRDIQHNDGLAPDEHGALAKEIAELEHHYFVEERAQAPDLRRIAESWIERTS